MLSRKAAISKTALRKLWRQKYGSFRDDHVTAEYQPCVLQNHGSQLLRLTCSEGLKEFVKQLEMICVKEKSTSRKRSIGCWKLGLKEVFMEPEDLDSWRIFFKTSGFNIFTIIDNAIMVAAKDYASHLRLRRDRIISLLYNHSCPCKGNELSDPLEDTNVSRPNADRNITFGRNCCEGDSHQDKNGRVHSVGLNLSVEQNNSVMVICNDETQMDKPTNVEDGCNKELEAVGDAHRNDGVEHQNKSLLLVPAKNIAVKQSGDSKLGSDVVPNKDEVNVLENLENTINYPQDGLNKNTIVEGSSVSKDMASNGISNDKDGALLEYLNRINANQSGGSKELSVYDALNDDCGDLREGLYKNTAERHPRGFDGGPNLLRMSGSEYEQTRGRKDLIDRGDDRTKEVVEIKKVLENCEDQPNTTVLGLLMKLVIMDLDFEILKVTQIGVAVNAVRKYAFKHGMKEIRETAGSLIRDWKTKADEWMKLNSATEGVQSSAKDQCPSSLLIEGMIVDPLVPTLNETAQAFDRLDGDFFSILPQTNILGDFYTNGELGFTEEELLQIDEIPWKFDSSVSIREEDPQQQPLPLQETSNFVEKQPTDKNGLSISGDSKQVKKIVDTTKLGNQVPSHREPESNGNRKRRREDNVVASNSQLKPKGLSKDSNAAKPELRAPQPSFSKRPEHVRTSRSNEHRELERTRRKLHERYRKNEDVKKQHSNQILPVNHPNQEYKRHKHHHAQSEKASFHGESSGAKHSSQKSVVQRHPPSSSSRK